MDGTENDFTSKLSVHQNEYDSFMKKYKIRSLHGKFLEYNIGTNSKVIWMCNMKNNFTIKCRGFFFLFLV